MTISAHRVSRTPRWSHAFNLLCAMVLLPIGLAYAQDDDKPVAQAVEKQFEAAGMEIRAAVANGELPEAEAWSAWIAARREIISGAVQAGTISEAKAAGWLQEINKEELGGRLRAAGGRIKAAAASGELTEDEAWAEWYATKEELIDGAVAAGEISAQDAAEFRRGIHKAELGERLRAAGGRIKEAVVSGEMTEDEGWAEWEAAREELIAEAEESGEISEENAADYRRALEKDEVGRKLRAAVALGEMTEEEAWAAWADYNNETDQIAEKLEAMVARGELTAEEAEAKLLAIENALAAKSKASSLDARTVLRAAKRVDLNRDQRDEIRDIERATIGVYRKISRKDKEAHGELAERVKAEITKLLDAEQIEQFEAALKRLDRGSRRGKQPQRRQVAPESDPDAKKSP